MKKLIVVLLIVVSAFSVIGCKEEVQSLDEYEMSVKLNEDYTLICNLSYSFTAKADRQNSVYFSLFPNAFSERADELPVYDSDLMIAYPNGKSYGKVDVLGVKQNGKNCAFSVCGTNEETLKVELNKTLNKGESGEIYIDFKVYLPNVKHRFGYGDNTVNLSGFYPIACVYEDGEFYENVYSKNGDPFYSDCANYSVRLTVPSAYTVASSLNPIKTVWSGGETEYYYEQNCVREVAFFISTKYEILEKTVNDVSVKYYYFDDKTPEKTLQTACDSIEFYSNNYYKYPYKTYSVCEGDFIYGGMEYPCLSLVSSDVDNNYRDYVVAHETAHQWFYGIVGFNQSEVAFLDEGLTELSTALFLSSKEGGKSYDEYLIETKNSYLAIQDALKYVGNTRPPIMDRNLKDFSSQAEYVMIAYNRAEITFSEIKKEMGDKKFFKFLREFIKKNAYKNVNLQGFRNFLGSKSKEAVKIFDGYVSGKTAVL